MIHESEVERQMQQMGAEEPSRSKVTFEAFFHMESDNLKTLNEIIDRHKADQDWLDATPESSRVLYPNLIKAHKDRGALLKMFTNADIQALSKGERIQVEAKIGLLSAEITRITQKARDDYQNSR